MVDDGYLIGYEDTNGDFVEVGRFNNQAEDTTQPIEVVHANSGETIELGPNGFVTDSVTAGSVNTEKLFAKPLDTIITPGSDQTIPNDDQTIVDFGSVRRDTQNLADVNNNAIQIPSSPDFSFIKLYFAFQFLDDTTGTFIDIEEDGNNLESEGGRLVDNFEKGGEFAITSSYNTLWIPVSGGETYSVKIRHQAGQNVELFSGGTNFSAVVR